MVSTVYRFIGAPLFLGSSEGTCDATQFNITIEGSINYSSIDNITYSKNQAVILNHSASICMVLAGIVYVQLHVVITF